MSLISTTPSYNEDDTFASCNECIEALGDNCWCWEAEEDDYLQVFIIALFIMLMYLAGYCLGYARSLANIGGISEMNGFPCTDMAQVKSIRNHVKALSFKYTEEGKISGIPIPIFIIFNSILAAIYFTIKMIIYFENTPHYLSTINQDFNESSWSQFYDARIILLTTIYCHSMLLLHENVSIYMEHRTRQKGTWINMTLIICTLILFTDFISSIVLMCIKYPLLITALYHGAIGILVLIGFYILCCCLFRLIACYSKCISRPIDQPCKRFIMGVINGFILLLINYLYTCATLCIAFAFLGGPNYTVIYLDLRERSTDLIIAYLYIAATCIGIIGFLIGAATTTYKQCYDEDIKKSSSKPSKKGYHQPQETQTEFAEC